MMDNQASGFEDDLSINGEDELWRRIPKNPDLYIFDPKINGYRPTSAAFYPHTVNNGISVLLASIAKANSPHAQIVAAKGGFLASVTARKVRELNLGIARTGTTEEPAHADIFDKLKRPKEDFPHTIRKALARRCTWVIRPDT